MVTSRTNAAGDTSVAVGSRNGDILYPRKLQQALPSLGPDSSKVMDLFTAIVAKGMESDQRVDLFGYASWRASDPDVRGSEQLNNVRGGVLAMPREMFWRDDNLYTWSSQEQLYESRHYKNSKGEKAWEAFLRGLSNQIIVSNLGQVLLYAPLPIIAIERMNPNNKAQRLCILWGADLWEAAPFVEVFAPGGAQRTGIDLIETVLWHDISDYDFRNLSLRLKLHFGAATALESYRQVIMMGDDWDNGRRSEDSPPFPQEVKDLPDFLGVTAKHLNKIKIIAKFEALGHCVANKMISIDLALKFLSEFKAAGVGIEDMEMLLNQIVTLLMDQNYTQEAAESWIETKARDLKRPKQVKRSAVAKNIVQRFTNFGQFIANHLEEVREIYGQDTFEKLVGDMDGWLKITQANVDQLVEIEKVAPPAQIAATSTITDEEAEQVIA